MAASASADTVLADLRGHKFATEESLEDEKEKKTEAKAETKESASKAYVSFRDLRKTSLYAIFKSNEEEQEHQFNFLHRSWNMDYLKVNFFCFSSFGKSCKSAIDEASVVFENQLLSTHE